MAWYGWLLIGFCFAMVVAFIVVVIALSDKISRTEINTRKITQKRNENSTQDVTNKITQKKERTPLLKRKRLKKANNN